MTAFAHLPGVSRLPQPSGMSNVRPKRIVIEWSDPFDDRPLCSEDRCYEPRKAAEGFYLAHVNRLTAAYKSLFSDILQGRSPVVSVTFIR